MRPKDAPWNMAAAMVLFAVLCVAIGVMPELFYRLLPYPVDYHAYTPGKVLYYLQLLLYSGLAFFVMLPWLKRTNTISLDIDWFYRVAFFRITSWLGDIVAKPFENARRGTIAMLQGAGSRIYSHYGPEGVLARTWPTGSMVLWVAILLAAYLVMYYL